MDLGVFLRLWCVKNEGRVEGKMMVVDSNYWLTCITVEPEEAGFTREDVRLALDADNIESRPLWKPMHLQPVFKDAPFYGNGTSERLFEIGLCLPSGPTLTNGDVDRVTRVICDL